MNLSAHASSPPPPPPSSTTTTAIPKIPASQIDTTFSTTTNLTSSALAATILSCSDEWFAEAKNLLTPTPPVRKPGVFVYSGAWYDGWETRRHNPAPFDWVVISLGCVGRIAGVEIDTAWFNGNEAPEIALEGYCHLSSASASASESASASGATADAPQDIHKESFPHWSEILPVQSCGPNQRQAWSVTDKKQYTHLRLKMFPDGGIARLRVYGHVFPPPLLLLTSQLASQSQSQPQPQLTNYPLEDLAATLSGSLIHSSSNQHFGAAHNLTLPGRGASMGDGWETARSRVPGHEDWVIVRLGLEGRTIERVVVDTKSFRGNFPRAVRVEGWAGVEAQVQEEEEVGESNVNVDSAGWIVLVPDTPCQADREHVFEEGTGLVRTAPGEGRVWTHVKMTIVPDGGVMRLRVWGRKA